MHASGFVRYPCEGHFGGHLWLLQACDFSADFRVFEVKNMTLVNSTNSLRKYFSWGGYLVSMESSLKMQENGVYYILIS